MRGRIIIRVIAEEDQVPGSGTLQLILLGGLPGSGKTSRGRRVAEEILAVRLCGDDGGHALASTGWTKRRGTGSSSFSGTWPRTCCGMGKP